MFDNLSKKLYKKIATHPCNICLVKATCPGEDSYKRKPCEAIDKYKEKIKRADEFGDWLDLIGGFSALGVFLLFILATFGLGIWKWFEIIKHFFK